MDDSRLFGPPRDLDHLQTQLVVRQEKFWDDIIEAERVRMDPSSGYLMIRPGTQAYPESAFGHLKQRVFEERQVRLQAQALEQIAVRLRIPTTYLLRCPNQLQAQNVNHWLEGLGRRLLFLRFDGEELRALLTPSYVPISNAEIISRFSQLSLAKNLVLSVRYEWTPTHFIAQLVETGRDLQVVGDTLLGGIQISNSETGHSSLVVSAMLLRLVCTNGMIVKDEFSLRKVHRTDPKSLLDELDDTVGRIWDGLPALLAPVRTLSTMPLRDHEQEIHDLVRKEKLSEEQHNAILQAWMHEPGGSMLFLMHAVTRAANDSTLTLLERIQLQGLGGEILSRVN